MDSSLFTGLLNIAAAAIASIAIAFFEPAKNIRAALFTTVCATALINFYFQRVTTADLQQKLRPLTLQRSISESQAALAVSALSKFPAVRVTIVPIWATAEVTRLTNELANVLNVALIAGGAPKYEGNLPPVVVQNLDNRFFSSMGDGITVRYRRDASSARDFSYELIRLLASADIRARALEHDNQKSEFVLVYVGAIPPN